MRHYYCVNCGYHGDFKFNRKRNVVCQVCKYDPITELDTEDWAEYGQKMHKLNTNDKYYKNFKDKTKDSK